MQKWNFTMSKISTVMVLELRRKVTLDSVGSDD